MWIFFLFSVLVVLVSADPIIQNDQPDLNIQNINDIAPPNKVYQYVEANQRDFAADDGYTAPQGPIIAADDSSSTWTTTYTGESNGATYYPAPAPTYGSSNQFGIGAGANVDLGFKQNTGLGGIVGLKQKFIYAIIVILGITSIAQIVTKLMNSTFLNDMLKNGERSLDPELISTVLQGIKNMAKKYE